MELLRFSTPTSAQVVTLISLQALSDPESPGSDIYIHGKDRSHGCAPVGDDAVEELYLITFEVCNRGQSRIPIHIFPARMSGPDWAQLSAAAIAENPSLERFWKQLQPAYAFFEKQKLLPAVTVAPDGSYELPQP